jgi:DNA-binding CsgD family transcriptional regulator
MLRPSGGVALRLERAVRALVSPASTTSTWAVQAVGELRTLCRARQAAVLVSYDGACKVHGDPDAAALLRRTLPPAAGRDAMPTLPGRRSWRGRASEQAAIGVTEATAPSLASTAIWSDEPRADVADTIALLGPIGGADGLAAGVCCCFEAPLSRRVVEARLELLRIVRPALEAGVRQRLARHEDGLLPMSVLDALDDGAAVCTRGGVPIATNAALAEMLRTDPEAARLRRQLALSSVLAPVNGAGAADVEAELRTACARYRVRRWVLPGTAADRRRDVVLLLVRRIDRTPVSWAVLRRRYGLTARECEVVALLYDGQSNVEIARALAISPYTARHHTARVLQKLGARTRGQIAAVLAQAGYTGERRRRAPLADEAPASPDECGPGGWGGCTAGGALPVERMAPRWPSTEVLRAD